jgi:PAS domain S-box-containing protein
MNSQGSDKLFGRMSIRGTHPMLLRRLRRGVFFFYALTLVMVLITAGWLSLKDYRDTLQGAERQSMSLARSLDEHATRSMVSVEQAMQNLIEDIERSGGTAHLDERWAHERLQGKISLTPQIRGIIAINAKGILVAHGLEYPTRRVDLSDRLYFPYHRDHDDAHLRIGEPLVSRTDYKWLIPVTLRINNPDGSFGGVMLSGVEPDYFLKFYESLHLERGTRIQLLRSDGMLLLSYPLDITRLGAEIERSRQDGFRALTDSNLTSERQFIAQISSQNVPITIRVITDPDWVLRKFYHDAQIRIISLLFIVTVLTLMLFLLLRQIRRAEESESRLLLTQFAVDESPDMVLWCDPRGRLRYANQRLAELSGYTPDELLSLKFQDLIGGNELKWDRLYADLRDSKRKTMESLLRKKDQSVLAIELTLSPIADKQDQYLCISARDISERHAAQMELRHHRDHLQELVDERTAEIRTMLDANPLAVVLSVDEHVQSVNPAFESQFGYSMNSISGLPESVIHASAANYLNVRNAIRNRIASGATFRGEAELRRSDGSLFWAQLFVRTLQSNAPDRGVLYIIEDVTAQRVAAQALRQSEQLKRTILDTTSDGFALIDSQRRFVDINQMLCEQLGQTRPSILGQPLDAVWSKGIAVRVFPPLQTPGDAGAQLEIDLPVSPKETRPFLISRGQIRNASGLVEYSFAFFTDISHQKEIERSLMEAKEVAEIANQAKSVFLTNMSHELRTPMHAILSFAELGMHKAKGGEPQDLLRYFERIDHAGKHLLTLLNDLLDMSRMETHGMDYRRGVHILQHTMAATIAELTSQLTAKQIEVVLDQNTAQISAVYDRIRIAQVILNLMSNAIRFSPPEGRIFISYLQENCTEEHPARVGFSIRDEGPGIAPERLSMIFDLPQHNLGPQADVESALGLSLCHRIISDHGGSIEAANHPGGGAIMSVRLPVEPDGEAQRP